MTEEIKTLAAEIVGMEQDAAIAKYLELPKEVRRAVYNPVREQDAALAKKIRAAAEERRGIGFRTLEGDLVLAREAMKEQLLRLQTKRNAMDERKAVLAERMVEIKNQAQKFYGDDFLTELETALEQA